MKTTENSNLDSKIVVAINKCLKDCDGEKTNAEVVAAILNGATAVITAIHQSMGVDDPFTLTRSVLKIWATKFNNIKVPHYSNND